MITKPILRWLRRSDAIALIGIGANKTTKNATEPLSTWWFNHVLSTTFEMKYIPDRPDNVYYVDPFESDLPFEEHAHYQKICCSQMFTGAQLGFAPRLLLAFTSRYSVQEFKEELMLKDDFSYTVIRAPDGSSEKYEWSMLEEHGPSVTERVTI